MPTMYKLVSQDYTTQGGMKWKIGKTNKATGKGNKLCTDGVLHCYASPLQASFLAPLHVNFVNPILLEIECSEIVDSDTLKYASKEQTPKSTQTLPKLTTNQRIAVAIKVALLVNKLPSFVKWAENWLSGVDRAAYAARAAAPAAAAMVRAAAYTTYAAAYTTYAAARAAYAAAPDWYGQAHPADDATYAAAYAARAAAYAARAAADTNTFPQTLQSILEWVVNNIC